MTPPPRRERGDTQPEECQGRNVIAGYNTNRLPTHPDEAPAGVFVSAPQLTRLPCIFWALARFSVRTAAQLRAKPDGRWVAAYWIVRRTWLFVRGGESIWLQRPADGALRIAFHGSQTDCSEFAFHGELELLDFLHDVDRRLVEKGWTLQRLGPEDRRTKTEDSNVGARLDRRRQL